MLQFALFQNFRDIKDVLKWLDPQGLSKEKLDEKVSFPSIPSHTRIFSCFKIDENDALFRLRCYHLNNYIYI